MEVRAETCLLALATGRSLVSLRIEGGQSPDGVSPVEDGEKELGTVRWLTLSGSFPVNGSIDMGQ